MARESSGKEKSTYKEEEIRARPGAPPVSSLACERANELTVHTGEERTERASERARSL